MISHFSHVHLFATPWTVAHQALLSMGFSRQGYWSGLPCPPPGDLPHPGIEPWSYVSCIGRWVLNHYCHLGSLFYSLDFVHANTQAGELLRLLKAEEGEEQRHSQVCLAPKHEIQSKGCWDWNSSVWFRLLWYKELRHYTGSFILFFVSTKRAEKRSNRRGRRTSAYDFLSPVSNSSFHPLCYKIRISAFDFPFLIIVAFHN